MNLHPHARKSSRDYVKALLEASAKLRVDPIRLLKDTAEVPKASSIDMLEFLVGWFHGVAEANGMTVEGLWAKCYPEGAPAPRGKRWPVPKPTQPGKRVTLVVLPRGLR